MSGRRGPRSLTRVPARGAIIMRAAFRQMGWVLFALLLIGALTCATQADEKDDLAKYTKDAKSKDAKVRLNAVEKLAGFGKEASKPLCDAMLDVNAKVATAALFSLEKSHPQLHKSVSKMALDQKLENQVAAIQELEAMGAEAKPALGLMIARAKVELKNNQGKSELRGPGLSYVRAIAAIDTQDEESALFFQGATASTFASVRAVALDWLINWAPGKDSRRKALAPVVKAGLADSADAVMFIKAAGALGEHGKDLLPALKKLQLSKTESVREAAKKAIEKIG